MTYGGTAERKMWGQSDGEIKKNGIIKINKYIQALWHNSADVWYYSFGHPVEIKCHESRRLALRCSAMLVGLFTAQTVAWAKSVLCLWISGSAHLFPHEMPAVCQWFRPRPTPIPVNVCHWSSKFSIRQLLFFLLPSVFIFNFSGIYAFKGVKLLLADEQHFSVKLLFSINCLFKIYSSLLSFHLFAFLKHCFEPFLDPAVQKGNLYSLYDLPIKLYICTWDF